MMCIQSSGIMTFDTDGARAHDHLIYGDATWFIYVFIIYLFNRSTLQ